jgi:dolichol-phosphate mannosyltransferase
MMGHSAEAIVVDDDSPDGTGELVRETYRDDDRVRVVIRRDDQGLSGAVLEGLRRARARYCVVMDADGQHPPRMVASFVSCLRRGAAIAVGSRHIIGGEIRRWSLGRRLSSRVSSAAARLLLPSSRATSDPMSGFFAVDREIVDDDILAECDPHGYKILLELLSRAGDVDVADVPITFWDRQAGESKLTPDEVVRFLEHTAGLGLKERDVDLAAPKAIRALELGLASSLAFCVLMLGLIIGGVDGAGGAALIGFAGGLLTLGLVRFIRTAESWTDTEERYAKP